jgi:hypothetical protein
MAFENLHHLTADTHRFRKRRKNCPHYQPLDEQGHQLYLLVFLLFFSFLR